MLKRRASQTTHTYVRHFSVPNARPNFFKRMQRTVSRVWDWEGTGDKDISDTERTVQRIWLTLRAAASVRRA